MSKVKLVICKGYGSNERPYITEEAKIVDTGIEVGDDFDIVSLIRTEFDTDSDGSRRVSDEIDPVMRYEAINGLVGKILTIVDATFADTEQRKAQKDLLKQACWDWYTSQGDELLWFARNNTEKSSE